MRKMITLTLLLMATAAIAAEAPSTAPATQPDGPAKFYGAISAVDAAAKTITIDNQTYSIVGETQMTKAADDSAATFADAVVGEPARGTYTKSTDGTLHVTKVRFGRKTGGKAGGKKAAAATQPQAQ